MNKRQYKKKYYICKDTFGKSIYVGDTVELYCPWEINSKWNSIVYWSMLHGAYVDSHPTHKILQHNPNAQRELYYFLKQDPFICYDEDDNPTQTKQGYCKKIKSFYTK
jgi:hypothetical protein